MMKPRKRLRTVGAEVAGTWRGDACVAQERGSRQGTRATTRDNTFQRREHLAFVILSAAKDLCPDRDPSLRSELALERSEGMTKRDGLFFEMD